ncbi:MAG: hypothetical protein EA401_07635 [Planctomycetota bacterium]|nr:MAG: hypothetical protein EA401_07635 [Planctomycetota bacterium]
MFRAVAGLAPYLHVMRTVFLTRMAYRMRYVTGIATYSIFVGVHYAIWSAVYRDLGEGAAIGGMDLAMLTTYLAVGYMARAAYYTNTDSEIASRFQSGEVVMDLLKPISFHGNWLSQAAGETAFRLLFFTAPMAVVMVPLFAVMPPSGDGWWQFPVLFLIAFWCNSEINAMAGTLCFFLEDITGLMSLKRNLVMLGSGLLVPLHFLEPLIGATAVNVLVSTPLALIGYYPTLAYVGGLGEHGVHPFSIVLVLGLGWVVILRIANMLLWRTAIARLEVQGG